MIKIRPANKCIEKTEYSNYEDFDTYPSSIYTCDSCGEKIKFNFKDLDKHRFIKHSNLKASDQKIMDKLILSIIPKSKRNSNGQIATLSKKDRWIVLFQRIILRLNRVKTPFPPIPDSNENVPDSYIDFYCPKCNRPVRIYYFSYLGGKHGEHGYVLKYVVD